MSGSPESRRQLDERSEMRERAREVRSRLAVDLAGREVLPIEEDLKTDEIAARQRCRLGNRLLLPRLGGGDAANCQENCDGGAQLSGTEPHMGRNCTTHTGLRWGVGRPLGLPLPRRAQSRTALMMASMWDRYFSSARRPAVVSRYSVWTRASERLVAGDVLRLFQLARVDAQVAVRRLQQPLEIVERQPLVHRQRADDAKPQPLVDQPIELERTSPPASTLARRLRPRDFRQRPSK